MTVFQLVLLSVAFFASGLCANTNNGTELIQFVKNNLTCIVTCENQIGALRNAKDDAEKCSTAKAYIECLKPSCTTDLVTHENNLQAACPSGAHPTVTEPTVQGPDQTATETKPTEPSAQVTDRTATETKPTEQSSATTPSTEQSSATTPSTEQSSATTPNKASVSDGAASVSMRRKRQAQSISDVVDQLKNINPVCTVEPCKAQHDNLIAGTTINCALLETYGQCVVGKCPGLNSNVEKANQLCGAANRTVFSSVFFLFGVLIRFLA